MEAIKRLLGVGKPKDLGLPGTKFANLLSMGLKAKGFREEVFFTGEDRGYRYSLSNDIGAKMVFTFGGGKERYKETPVSVLFTAGGSKLFKDSYKTYEFPTIDMRVDPQDLEKVKKLHQANHEHEERQRTKVNKIYNIVGAFKNNDLSKVKELMGEEDTISKTFKAKEAETFEMS
jgi:hypothetical protein